MSHSLTRNGTNRPIRFIVPTDFGTKTAGRGFFSTSTIASATFSGVTALINASFTPNVNSVRTIDGSTHEISTPEPRSSCRTASDNPTTPCLVAEYVTAPGNPATPAADA